MPLSHTFHLKLPRLCLYHGPPCLGMHDVSPFTLSSDSNEFRWLTDLTTRRRFDSSVGRGDFVTAIGVGRVIKGMYCTSPLEPAFH
jgi:hypothetical protein